MNEIQKMNLDRTTLGISLCAADFKDWLCVFLHLLLKPLICTHILALLPEKANGVVAKDEQKLGAGHPMDNCRAPEVPIPGGSVSLSSPCAKTASC